MSYGTSLITNIVENLQLNIKDVHIRYEDSITIPENPFCCGLTIESLTAQSCDTNWIPGFTSNWTQNDATFKLIELNSLSFYLDTLDAEIVLSKCESNELADGIENLKLKSKYNYIIKPVSAQAKLKRDRSEIPLRTRNRPRLTCNLIWNEISLSLNENQYTTLVTGIRGLDDVAKFKKYRLLQPKTSIKEDARAWWHYAARCHGYIPNKNLFLIAKNNLRYIKICKRLIVNPNEILQTEDKEFKENFEKEKSLNNLRELREICMIFLPQTNEIKSGTNNQGKSLVAYWFPQWWGNYGSNSTPSSQSTPSSGTPSLDQNTTFEDEFLNALADTVETNSILKRDAVFGKFQFMLRKGSLDVFRGGFKDKIEEAVQFHFEELILNVESRPRSGSHFVSLSLGSIMIKDYLTPNTEFPDIIKPQSKDELLLKTKMQRSRLSLNLMTACSPSPPANDENIEPLFLLEYENKPLGFNTDYRLLIKSRSLDIVYNTEVMTWIIEFLSKPHVQDARKKIEAMKYKTKMELKRNLNDIMEGRLSERKTWTFEIDISAPQILFVENFIDRQCSTIVVIDLGHLQLSNGVQTKVRDKEKNNALISDVLELSIKDSEEDELFLTPCSTPPDLEQAFSPESSQLTSTQSDIFQTPLSSNAGVNKATLPIDDEEINESNLYHKIYDRYEINLTDIQILVCKGKERWNFASSKGTSNLHVLDRFNISLQMERRIVNTTDPQYPSFTLCGSLPKLNVHINESKIASITNMLNTVFNTNLDSPFKSTDSSIAETIEFEEEQASNYTQNEPLKLILLQFSVDQMSLEVQSCGRSIVELQVSGVKAGLTQRASDTNMTLSVHGLLLVDAMQSYGPDFELLIASHRHVGMDSLSGSLRQSEPCSPNSPGSPDPSHIRPTSPLSLSKAISSLQRGKLLSIIILIPLSV
jgi:vacuolar protein sorting-associated protein 13D